MTPTDADTAEPGALDAAENADAGGPGTADAVDAALEAFADGEPVCIHDAADREGETDLVYPAGAVTPAVVARLRNDAGGLVCVAVTDDVAATYGLPFADEAVDHPAADDHDLAYDDRTSFSLTVNHRETATGITDADRARTITELAAAATRARATCGQEPPTAEDFASEFRTPGHVHLLRAAPDLLFDRQGHTELGLAIAETVGIAPAVVVCEMLDDESGEALAPADARAYAERHGVPYVEGADLLERLG